MAPDKVCFDFIKSREGLKLKAYQDSAGIWTIGYGSIHYEDGKPIKRGDTITQERADKLLEAEIILKSIKVNAAIKSTKLTQNQYNALVSFAYNVGTGALLSSTLLKKVLANRNDPSIKDSFLVWNKAHVDGKLVAVAGLTNRRRAEADLYFTA
jgi:lysozyme